MRVAIVGNEAGKFTELTEDCARNLIYALLTKYPSTILISGGCHLGGIDIWAEECADAIGVQKQIYLPEVHSWEAGYKPRNILIADNCDECHNVVVEQYPSTYSGMRFHRCYHCLSTDHVKSGGCWTARYAKRCGKKAYRHVIDPAGTLTTTEY